MEQYSKELTPVHYNDAALVSLHLSRKQNDSCFRMHWHERLEIIRILNGEMYVTSGNRTTKLCAEDLTIFPPRMAHKGYTTDSTVEYDVLMFDVRSFYNDTKVCQRHLPILYEGRAHFNPVITDSETVHCVDTIVAKCSEESFAVVAEIYKLFYLLFERNTLEWYSRLNRNDQISEMIKYIEEHFQEKLTVEMCATKFGYSKEHFCRKFKHATGLTPMNYLKIYRMEEAYNMVEHGNSRVQTIAEHCGFDDANYFTRCFKAHFGVAPTGVNKK